MMLSDVCLSRTSGLTRELRGLARKTKIGTQVAHVTRDSDTSFKVQRSRSPGRFTHRGVNASGSCSGDRGNVFIVGKLLLRCGQARSARRRFGAHRRRRGAGAYRGGRPPAYSLFSLRRPNSVRTVQQIVCNTTTEKRVCSCTHNTTHCSVILHKTNTKVHCTIQVCNQFVIGISALHSFYTCYL